MAKSVAILGCGPSGLMVAHAADMLSWNFRIFGTKKKSMILGSQYLHKPIPGMTSGPVAIVDYHLEGTPEDYRSKVYGPSWTGTDDYEYLDESHHYAWNMRDTYDKMWKAYEPEIKNYTLCKEDAPLLNNFDLVISTIPRTMWAEPGDVFRSTKIWIAQDSEDRCAPFRPREFTVICDGTPDVGFYKASNIFGHCTVEWPESKKPPLDGILLVERPLSHNSKAASDFKHLGQFGSWDPQILVTDVFDQALEILAEDKI